MSGLSKKYANTQTFKINQSPLLNKGLIVLHIIAIFAVFLNALILTIKFFIIALVLLSLFYYLKQSLNFKGISIRHNSEFGWEIIDSENYFNPIEILSTTVLTHYLIVLHFKKQNNKKKTILICRDALENDKYRKLMVELKVSGLNKDVL